MIYIFHGSDVDKIRTKAFEWVAKARAKEPNLIYARLSREELTDSTLEDASISGGLFVKRLLVLIDDPFQNNRKSSEGNEDNEETNSGNIIEKYLDTLAESDNAIIILAPKLLSAKAKKLVAKAKVEYKYNLPVHAGKSERGFNSNLVNALENHSREKLWLELNRALRAGDAPEMLCGLLHWKARDMRNRQLSLSIISLLQSSRRGGLDLPLSLEKFSLSI